MMWGAHERKCIKLMIFERLKDKGHAHIMLREVKLDIQMQVLENGKMGSEKA